MVLSMPSLATASKVIVTLTKVEMFSAAQAGCLRRINALCKDLPQPYGKPKDPLFDIDVESSGAEMAVAKAFGLYWNTYPNEFRDLPGDVANLEVRWTKHMNGHLIVHKRDKDDRPFVLVRGNMPHYKVGGWMMGADAKQEKWIHGMREEPGYWVPNDQLHSLADLKVIPQKIEFAPFPNAGA